jgi:hypothetical protein
MPHASFPLIMARGFESKGSAEYADTGSREERRSKPRLTSDEVAKNKKREELELTRSRLVHELAATTSEMRRNSLRAALTHIEGEIAKL